MKICVFEQTIHGPNQCTQILTHSITKGKGG